MLAHNLRGNHVHLGARLLERDARLQARNGEIGIVLAIDQLLRIECERRPDLIIARRKGELRPHYADNRVWHAAERDRLADDRPIAAESPTPQSVTQNRDLLVADLVFIFCEAADRRHAQHGQHASGNTSAQQALWLGAPADQIEIRDRAHRGDVFEHVVARFIVVDVRHRDVAARQSPARRRRPDVHEPIRIAVRQRPQQHAVHDAEHRRGRADAERDRQDGGCGEAGRPPHQPHAVLHVLREREQERDAARIARCLHQLRDGTELAARRVSCGLRRHAPHDVLLDEPLDVPAHLVAELGVDRIGSHQRPRALQQHVQKTHEEPSNREPRTENLT